MQALNNRSSIAILAVTICLGSVAGAQQSAAPSAWSPSKDIGVFVFAKNGQNTDLQLKDESDCYGAARQMSGIDPKAPAAPGKTAEQKAAEQKAAAENAEKAKGARAGGAARGAAGGAAIGAIAGDAGKGAGAGAVAGTSLFKGSPDDAEPSHSRGGRYVGVGIPPAATK